MMITLGHNTDAAKRVLYCATMTPPEHISTHETNRIETNRIELLHATEQEQSI